MARVGAMDVTENGEQEAVSNKVWYKCSRCHHNILFDESALQSLKDSAEVKTLSKEECLAYSPENSYSVGQAIYHQDLDDVGWIRDKQIMSDGRSAIIVTFQKLGERKLIDNLRPEDTIHPEE
jgi:hypothetical protein